MTPTRMLVAACAALLSADAARAGWDNAFQVACWHCRRPTTSNYYAPPAPVVAQRPPSTAVTQYEQRCEYEPVTVMKPESYSEPVQVQERRTYYEPSTTYTTRSYYDPATCKTESYSIPRTCMVRKEECNTVTKYVERVRMVPVQTQRKVCYRTPVTTITQYGPTTKSYECDNCALPETGAPPRATVSPGSPAPPPQSRIDPQTEMQSQPKPMPSRSGYVPPVNARTTSNRSADVQGEVVASDRLTPKPGVKVVFLSAADLKTRVEAIADDYGQFDANVPAGDWHIYLGSGNGKATLYQTVTIGGAGKQYTLVSR